MTTKPPDILYAWPSGAYDDWYAAGASYETTLVYDETLYIRKDIYDSLRKTLDLEKVAQQQSHAWVFTRRKQENNQ